MASLADGSVASVAMPDIAALREDILQVSGKIPILCDGNCGEYS